MFLRGLKDSARVVAARQRLRVGIRACLVLCRPDYQRALEDLIADGPFRDADALVWDLRDGWGGAEPQYLDLFNPHAPTMQVTDRNGQPACDVKWRKPVACSHAGPAAARRCSPMVSSNTVSARSSATHRRRGAGGHRVPDRRRGLLLLAVEDVPVDGQRLEGVGVTPTIEVPFDWRYAAGGTRSWTARCRCSARV